MHDESQFLPDDATSNEQEDAVGIELGAFN